MKTMFAILTLALIVGSAFGQSAELHQAAYSGGVSKVREILQKGVNPDDRDSFGGTRSSCSHVPEEHGNRQASS